MTVVNVSLGGLKKYVTGNRQAVTGAKKKEFNQIQMFAPVNTSGTPVVKSIRRLEFISENLGHWRMYHLTKAGAVGLAVLAVLLLPTNVYLSIAAGMGSAWCYGEYIKKNFIINQLLKKRYLLEGT